MDTNEKKAFLAGMSVAASFHDQAAITEFCSRLIFYWSREDAKLTKEASFEYVDEFFCSEAYLFAILGSLLQ